MNHHSESYKLYLRAQHLAEACGHLYHSNSRGEHTNYYMKEAQEYLDMIQIMLNKIKGESK